MSRRDFAIVAFKFLALYFIVLALYQITSIVYTIIMITSKNAFFQQFSYTPQLVKDAVYLALLISAIYIIFKYDRRIAEKVIPVDAEFHFYGAEGWQKELFTMALRIIGAVNLIKYLSGLIGAFIEMPDINKLQEKNGIGDIGYYLIMGGISVYLIMGASHFVHWVFRHRTDNAKATNPAKADSQPPAQITPEQEEALRIKQLLTIREEETSEQPEQPENHEL